MSGILKNTKNNIFRNKWLSLATILVATIVFVTASFFIALSLIAQRAVNVTQTKAQLQIYFEIDTPEGEISDVRDIFENNNNIESINYIDKDEALALYLDYYSDDPELIDSVSADWLPASLEVRAKTLDDLELITEIVRDEQETNPYIEEVVYHKDIVNQLKTIANGINYGAIGIIGIFSFITISLVFISIAFNIHAHRREIEIMHLIGTKDSYIKLPFILEGTLYTTLGAFFAATMIIVPWYMLLNYGTDTNAHFILTEIIKELDLKFLSEFSLVFVLAFYGLHLLVGSLIGFLSSSFAVMRNLSLKSK